MKQIFLPFLRALRVVFCGFGIWASWQGALYSASVIILVQDGNPDVPIIALFSCLVAVVVRVVLSKRQSVTMVSRTYWHLMILVILGALAAISLNGQLNVAAFALTTSSYSFAAFSSYLVSAASAAGHSVRNKSTKLWAFRPQFG